jgi:hypothetical protein
MLLWIHWTVTERQATGRGFQVPAREGFEGLLSPATEGLISCTPFLGASITLVRVQVVVCHRGRRQEPHQRTAQTGTCAVSVCKNACTDNDWINNFEGTRTAIQQVRASPAQDVDGGALVRVQGVVTHCGLRLGDKQDGSLVRVQGCLSLWTATRRASRTATPVSSAGVAHGASRVASRGSIRTVRRR